MKCIVCGKAFKNRDHILQVMQLQLINGVLRPMSLQNAYAHHTCPKKSKKE